LVRRRRLLSSSHVFHGTLSNDASQFLLYVCQGPFRCGYSISSHQQIRRMRRSESCCGPLPLPLLPTKPFGPAGRWRYCDYSTHKLVRYTIPFVTAGVYVFLFPYRLGLGSRSSSKPIPRLLRRQAIRLLHTCLSQVRLGTNGPRPGLVPRTSGLAGARMRFPEGSDRNVFHVPKSFRLPLQI